MKKLDQVCEIVGMTKRVISQYEANGCAIVPKHKNKYGHILYGEKEIQRLCQIRLYRELGYTSKQIKERFSLDFRGPTLHNRRKRAAPSNVGDATEKVERSKKRSFSSDITHRPV